MANEVKALIASLTSERNSIDRAIQALQQMHEVKIGVFEAPRPKAVKARKVAHRQRISTALKATVVAAMENADSGRLGALAHSLADEHGINTNTVYTQWRSWAKDAAVRALIAPTGVAQEPEAIPA